MRTDFLTSNDKTAHKKIIIRLCCVFICLSVSLSFGIRALAFNNEYLSPAKWRNNKNVVSVSINKTATGHHLYGKLDYFVDNSSLTFYTRFSVKEENGNDSLENAKVIYKITTPSDSNDLSVGRDGIINQQGKIPLEVKTNYANAEYGEIISAVEYRGKESELDIEVSFSTNRNYNKLLDKVHLELPETTRPEKTTLPKTTKAKTTRPPKAATTKVTKFVPKYKNGTAKATGGKASASSESGETLYQTTGLAPENETETQLYEKSDFENRIYKRTKMATILLIIGTVLGIAGIIMLLYSLINKNKNSSDGEENENE
ncbi:MAG: hypothetical protein IJT65_01570 [Eubacterium sp.]|nr:hypothetical protein [Eubacterium sp.]